MDFKKYFVAAIISIVLGNIVVGLVLAFLDFDVWAYVWALITQGAIIAIMVWILNPIKITWKWSWPHTRQLVRYGGKSTLFNSMNYLATRLDVLLVPKFTVGANMRHNETLGTAGIYERSTYIMMIPITIMGKISDNVMFSGMSMIQEDKLRLRKAFGSATYIISLLLLPTSVFVIFFAPELVLLYLGDAYASGIPVVRILFTVVAFRSLIKLCDSLLKAVDAIFLGSIIKFIFLLMIGFGTWIGIGWGITGVAYGLAIATITQYILMMIFCKTLIGYRFTNILKKMSPAFVISMAVAFFSWLVFWMEDFYDFSNLVTLLLAIVINGIGVLAVAFLAPKIFGQGQDNVLLLVAQKLPKNSITNSIVNRLNR